MIGCEDENLMVEQGAGKSSQVILTNGLFHLDEVYTESPVQIIVQN